MSTFPKTPQLSGGAPISVTERRVRSLDCPSCDQPMDITDLRVGTNVACPSCDNVTWCPEYKPRWWFKPFRFVVSLIFAFFVGFFSSYLASYAYEHEVFGWFFSEKGAEEDK